MSLPAHIAETVTQTRTYQCLVCGARITPGIYKRAGYAEQALVDWIEYHRHGVTEEPHPPEPP